MNAYQLRHGDVLLERIGDSPAQKARTAKREVIVAEGEVTGHAHRVTGNNIRFDGQMLSAPEGATISHEEHAELVLVPGEYRVTRQQEWIDVDRPIRVRD